MDSKASYIEETTFEREKSELRSIDISFDTRFEKYTVHIFHTGLLPCLQSTEVDFISSEKYTLIRITSIYSETCRNFEIAKMVLHALLMSDDTSTRTVATDKEYYSLPVESIYIGYFSPDDEHSTTKKRYKSSIFRLS